MVNQTTIQETSTIRFGSGKVEVGPNTGELVDLGAMNNLAFKETWDKVTVNSGNAGIIKQFIKNHRATLTGDLLEINLSKMSTIRGGIDLYDTVAGTSANVTDESHVLTGTAAARLVNKNGAGTEVGSIVVTCGGTSAARNTDYVITVGTDGYTYIARVAASSVITSGATVLVDYSYTPNASKRLRSGGRVSLGYNVVRVTNKDESNKIFRITLYKASNSEGIDMTYQPDDADEPNNVKITLEGICDTTRDTGDQLFEIYDEQSV